MGGRMLVYIQYMRKGKIGTVLAQDLVEIFVLKQSLPKCNALMNKFWMHKYFGEREARATEIF